MRLVLEEIASRLKSGDYKNEEHVRVAIVDRLLQALGWDIWNPIEVNPEFSPVRNEDSSRVDIAVFMPPQHLRPAIFIEVKAVGKLAVNVELAERQLRDYNRNNQAEISVLTDGRLWRFYWAGAAGEFRQKCFEDIDLLDPDSPIEELESTFSIFLSRESLSSGNAVEQARVFLRRTDDQRTMFDVLPIALRDAELDPTSSKVECFIQRCLERGVAVTPDSAKNFILNNRAPTSTLVASPKEPLPKTTFDSDGLLAPLKPPAQIGALSAIEAKRLTTKKGAEATGKLLPNGHFVVFANSVAAAPTSEFVRAYEQENKGSYGLYKQLVNEKILLPINGKTTYQLSRDYEFSSWSAAASVFIGSSASGPRDWKVRTKI